MRAKEAKNIPIAKFLEYQGIQPKKQRLGGRELWYHSPLRQGDNNPSFKVDTEKNLWYDHGLSDGGDIIKLVCELTRSSVKDALAILEQTGLYSGSRYSPNNYRLFPTTAGQEPKKSAAGEKEKEVGNPFQVESVRDINAPSLIQYLEKRKIPVSLARRYLKQVSFVHTQKLAKYFGLGFESGNGYEIRNSFFKGFVGEGKSPTWINKQENAPLSIFEGIFDYLSFLEHHNKTELKSSVLILNSTNLKKQALEMIGSVNNLAHF